jgi:hypothetical protein
MQPTLSKKHAIICLAFTGVVAVAVIGLTVLLETGPAYDRGPDGAGAKLFILGSFVFCVVGGFVAINRPDNLVGWSMMFSGAGILVGGLLSGYAEYVLLAHPGTNAPLALEAARVGGASWTFLMSGVFFLLVLFPSGQPSSKRWAFISRLVGVGFFLVWLTIITAPSDYDPPFASFGRNRLAFHDYEFVTDAVFVVIFFCLLAVLTAGIHLFFRFLRSSGIERAQFKWLAFSAMVIGLSLPFGGTDFGALTDVANIAFGVGLLTLPISVGIAVLRYRLYDIDRIINRTLVYALLTAGLGALYFGVVVGLQTVLKPLSGGNDLAIVITTLMVAALFLPARQRIQTAVERRFNRRAYDAALTVDAFSARLRDQIDLDTLRYELLAVVDETMQPRRTSLWLRPGRTS